jgi:CRISPR-associated endonuclease/helicase Cas3
MDLAGELIGLLHDLGKYSQEFQAYIQSATGLLNPDEDAEYVDAVQKRGKVDHSTAGAKLIWRVLSTRGPVGQIVGQILSLCVASHHSGLIDCLSTNPADGVLDNFSRRMSKVEERSHLDEALSKVDESVRAKMEALFGSGTIVDSLRGLIHRIAANSPEGSDKSQVAQFQIGLLVRFLFSCLIDADRQDTADFERPHAARARQNGSFVEWGTLVKRLETHLGSFAVRHPIDAIRQNISRHCLDASSRDQGIFTLTVPTGGGKTLASLRFALHHAHRHHLDRVVYIVPFTSIIDQNAEAVRKVLEPQDMPHEKGRVVLEHHSNLEPTRQRWRNKILSENWDAPVVFTTSVQFLEALFGAGTRGARRMHQLARSVIVFDEIQSLPVKCVHLFNNAVNFLTDYCVSTAVLCTATQPLLARVEKRKGAVKLAPKSELMPDVQALFDQLKRVQVKDQRRPGGWKDVEIADLAINQSQQAGSCLVVVNTKKAARGLYRQLEASGTALYHLSTSMCPAHRRSSLHEIRNRLDARHRLEDDQPLLCVSTQLIESGVDVDFGSVIRYAAGLDSIAQAAGRCNRNGARDKGLVHVVNPANESLAHLRDIEIGKQKAERVFDDFRDRPGEFGHDLLGPKAMTSFYESYFFARQSEMDYPAGPDKLGRNDTLLNLLSVNSLATGEYRRRNGGSAPSPYLRQSFMAANKEFAAIDAPTKGVLVPYGSAGKEIIADLCAAFDVERQFKLLHEAQQFTVNVFPHELKQLTECGALSEVQEGTGIHYLDQRYYSPHFGLCTELVSQQEVILVD